MRPELEHLQTLDAFLHGRLPAGQTRDLAIRELWDQDWQQQVRQQQLAYQAVREAGRQHLRHELRAIHRKLFGQNQ